MSKLSPMDRGVAGAAVVALIALFLPWYGASSGVYSASISGFSTSYGWLGALLIVATGAYIVLLRSGAKLPSLPAGPGVIVLGASLMGTVIIAIRWISLPRGSAGVSGVTYFSYGPRVGIIIALIAGVVQAACALRLFRASGEALPWSSESPAP
ncbi:MAG TPA: hypothetical protein VG368_07435 [Acidimicrobiales bacterium]|nr:hypothetical protein [Acidimicrobiales bacterium]